MPLTHLDKTTIGDALSCMWRTDLDTSASPSNDGKWLTNGANNDGIGLYGGLTDSVPTSLTFNTNSAAVTTSQITCQTIEVNNLNGTSAVTKAVDLSYSYSPTTSDAHTLVEAVTSGVKFTIAVNETVTKSGATFKVSFTWVSSDSQTTTSSTQTESMAVNLTVPAGKVYEALLTAHVQKLTIPYTCVIRVTGITETWFEKQVNGHYNYATDAGTAFGRINSFDCAGSDSSAYSNGGSSTGFVTLTGTVTVSQTVNFSSAVNDVTPS